MLTTTMISAKRLLPTMALLALTALTFMASSGAMAQAAEDPPAVAPSVASMAGRWLHDAQGNIIGSVRGPADGGRAAVLVIGSYFRPGSHVIRVPAGELSFSNGQVTLRSEVEEALNVLPQP